MLVITQNAVDITNLVKTEGFTIADAINSERDSLTFSIEKLPNESFVPQLNAEIIVTLDGVRIFGGTVIAYDIAVDEPPAITFTVECSDFTHRLDTSLITERFINQTGNAIIAYLFDTYATDFTYTNVVYPQTIARVSFNRLTMSQALDKLAKLANFNWYIDYSKNLHFFAKNNEVAPFNITEGGGNFVPTSLKVRKDIAQLRNKILVEGGKVPTAERTTKWIGDGAKTEFATNFEFATLPVVTVNGVAQTVGVEFLNTEGFDCYWSFQQKYVRFDPLAIPANTHTVHITGQPLVPIIAKVPLPTSIGVYGQYEFAVSDPTLKSQTLAIERAIAELDQYAEANNEAEFATYTAGLRSGQTITINHGGYGVNETYVIQRVEFTPFTNGSDVAGVWRVTLASTATLSLVRLLQKLLLDEKLEDDELQTLLTYLTFNENAVAGDEITNIQASSEPYNWDEVDWGYFKWG